ncbi:MAG: hypothetical protein KKC03_04225 [Bacteroidetes bacterium]|nr:hypothetical protein [Bacteroidota bacterium]
MEVKPLENLKKDFAIGFVLGLGISVIFGFLLLQYFAGDGWQTVFVDPRKLPALGAIGSLGALPNLGLFFWFLHKNQDQKAKGVFGFVMIFALCILILKLF